FKMPGIVPKLSDTPGSCEWVGPQLGEHNSLVLNALGYDAAAITRLREDGAI
ncbi:MAG: CoA transferase, partial [Pseudomonas sp.]|nr:CoA transferase [Pseudomonas sp.]